MKLLTLFLLMWTLNARADRPATHGMLLFGERTVYASHLPMFHAPHNYQAILQLGLKEADARATTLAAYAEAKKNSGGYFTLVPEPMDLSQVISGTKTEFKADIFDGHFERGGKNLGAVNVHVEKVVFAAKLNPQPAPSAEDYLVFGEAGEYYSAHLIVSLPSFDAIAAVGKPGVEDAKLPLTMTSHQPVTVLPKAGDRLSRARDTVAIQKVIYLEQDDLAD